MRLTLKPTLAALASVALLGCSVPTELDGSSPTALTSSRRAGGRPSRREIEISRALNQAAARRLNETPTARDKRKVGGLLTIVDSQLSNSHGLDTGLFFDDYFPMGCSVRIAVDGGACQRPVACDPPEPQFAGKLVPVGDLAISSTFDAIRLPSAFVYPTTTRPGPFWRGDGDDVTIAWTGHAADEESAGAPPFSRRMRAPVGDAVATVPTSADRSAPLRIDWRYANGSEAAVGDMLVTIFQQEPPAGVACTVPIGKKSITIPPEALGHFAPGGGSIFMSSIAADTFNTPLEEGGIKVIVSLSGSVDTGSVDADEPNVVFR